MTRPWVAEAAAELVERTCRQQGIPQRVAVPVVVELVAGVLAAAEGAEPQRQAS